MEPNKAGREESRVARWLKMAVVLGLATLCIVMIGRTVSHAEEVWYQDANGKRIAGEPPESVIAPHKNATDPGPPGYYAHGHAHPHKHPHERGKHHHHPHAHPHYPGQAHHHPNAESDAPAKAPDSTTR